MSTEAGRHGRWGEDATERLRRSGARLRERVYVTFTALAVLMAVGEVGRDDAGGILAVLLVTVVGVLLAGFTSDVVSHLVTHRALPARREVAHLTGVSVRALSAVAVPTALLLLAVVRVIDEPTALWSSIVVLLVALAVIVWSAVHGAHLAWWKTLLVSAAVVGLGALVVVFELLAHQA